MTGSRLRVLRSATTPSRPEAITSTAAALGARVLLVGHQDQDNLGLRYLSSRLRRDGHVVRIVSPESGALLQQKIEELLPDVVGFSLIFQFHVPLFRALTDELRRRGTRAHFTIGGHYASFEPERVLARIPALDSVVRFEGEETLAELVQRLQRGEPIDDLPGLALRAPEGTRVNATRAGRDDLDELPWPDRDDIPYERQVLPMASILGGRGCPWRCSFCSIITFYEGNGTRGRRRRDPRQVVDEMEHLCRARGVRILLWQDDDFLAGGRAGIDWAHAIAAESMRRGLHRKLRWKISCRSDELKPGVLEPLVEAGLTHVYLGVEAGNTHDLAQLNKLLLPETHLSAARMLREHELSFDFGFMLLEPWSDLSSLRANLTFLREFAGDGSAPIAFSRTLPYAGTPIEKRLRDEGRLDVDDVDANYRFLDRRLDAFYDFSLWVFASRHHDSAGSANLLRLLLFHAHLRDERGFADRKLATVARELTQISNLLVLDVLEAGLAHIETLPERALDDVTRDPVLMGLGRTALEHDLRLRDDLRTLLDRRGRIAELLPAIQ